MHDFQGKPLAHAVSLYLRDDLPAWGPAEEETEPIPEILMRGAKAEYAPIKINGRLIYISDGNAWMMEGSTENRTPLVSSGDLDGRVLDLSSDGQWLLFSRTGRSTEVNGLWMLDLSDWNAAYGEAIAIIPLIGIVLYMLFSSLKAQK